MIAYFRLNFVMDADSGSDGRKSHKLKTIWMLIYKNIWPL